MSEPYHDPLQELTEHVHDLRRMCAALMEQRILSEIPQVRSVRPVRRRGSVMDFVVRLDESRALVLSMAGFEKCQTARDIQELISSRVENVKTIVENEERLATVRE